MTDQTTPNVPPAWYPDPAGGPNQRWWDGTQWTEHYQQPYTHAAPAAALRAPEGTKVYSSPWIWLIVFLPYITLPFLFTIDFSSMFDYDLADRTAGTRAQLELLTSPGYLLSVLSSFVVGGLVVLFSYLDWKWLRAKGVPSPFHWAFGFFSLMGYPVYAIGRAVVTKRRTGHGYGVLWAVIGMFALAFVVAFIWVAVVFSTIMQQVMTQYPG